MKITLAMLFALSLLAVGSVGAQDLPNNNLFVPAWAQNPPNGIPVVRLDKSVFASGEAVFFWTGVQAINHASIPKEYWNTCRQIITRPDGTQKTERIGWPIDGPVGSGWIGGSGLEEKARPGRYLLEFEFAGQKTAPVPFVVEDVPALKDIQADFIFGAPAKLPSGSDTPVTLTVRNNTGQTLRFPHRDGMNGMVSFSLSKQDGKFRSDNFYPPEQLLDQDERKAPDHTVDNFTWKDAFDIPTITLKPGETYTQRLSLHTAMAEANKNWATTGNLSIPSGRYNVTFSTTLQVLVGEAGGQFTEVSPVHIPVASTAACMVGL